MSTNNLKIPWQDFHIHCLPAIDDGADSVETSYGMLRSLGNQGVRNVVATPHYYPNEQTFEEFIEQRALAVNALRSYVLSIKDPGCMPNLRLGAEVYIHRGLANLDVSELCFTGTRYLLVEPPYSDYGSWIVDEIWNTSKKHDVIPIFAHLERYLSMYSESQINELLSLPEFVVQINAAAFKDKKSIRFVEDLAANGLPIVLGTDAHNLTTRPADFTPAAKYLLTKRAGAKLLNHILQSEFLD
jgi:protein-tyrosine phosphatase